MELSTSLGICLWLMSQSEYHKNWTLSAVEAEIIAPILHGQVKIYFDDQENPVGVATWAWIGEEQKKRLLEDNGILEFDEWNGGELLLFNDYIAPWGHAKAILRDLRTQVFPNETAFSIGRNPDGSVRKVFQWKGVKVKEKRIVI